MKWAVKGRARSMQPSANDAGSSQRDGLLCPASLCWASGQGALIALCLANNTACRSALFDRLGGSPHLLIVHTKSTVVACVPGARGVVRVRGRRKRSTMPRFLAQSGPPSRLLAASPACVKASVPLFCQFVSTSSHIHFQARDDERSANRAALCPARALAFGGRCC